MTRAPSVAGESIRLQSTPSDSNNVLVVISSETAGVTLQAKKCLPNFTISQTLHKRLLQYVNMKKDKAGLLYGTAVSRSSFQLEFLSIVEEFKQEEVYRKIFNQEEACAIVIINNRELLKERLVYEVERCKEGLLPPAQLYKNQGISVLEQIYLSTMRMFLTVEEARQEVKVKQYSLFPNVTFNVKSLKLQTYKFDTSPLLSRLIQKQTEHEPSFKQQLDKGTYGFLVCNQTKLGVVKRNDPSTQSKTIVGLWIYHKGIKKESSHQLNPNSHRLIWGLAAMFLTNRSIVKTSVLVNQDLKKKPYANSFLLCVFSETSTKPYSYQVQVVGNENKWVLMENQEHILMPNVPLNFNMGAECELQSILAEPSRLELEKVGRERREEEREFVPSFKKYDSDNIATERNSSQPILAKRDSKSHRVYSNDTFARSEADNQSLRESQFNDKGSEKSYDEKDIQIRELKKELEFYKERYDNLERLVLSQSLFQQPYPPVFTQPFGMGQAGINGFQGTPPHPLPIPNAHVPAPFPYLNYPIPHQPMPPHYYPIPPPQFQQYSSQVNSIPSHLTQNTKMFQSSVVQPNKQSQPSDNFSFIKKQSKSELNVPPAQQTTEIELKEDSKTTIAPTPQHSSPEPHVPAGSTQEQEDKEDKSSQSVESRPKQQHFDFNMTNNQQQFEEFCDKQLDLNFSRIPHQKSPKPEAHDSETPQLQDYSSLAYSYSREHTQGRYTLPNEDSHQYHQNEQVRLIQNLFKSKFK